MSNEQKQSESLFVSAEVGQASSGDSGGNSAVVGQVFFMFKELVDKGKQIEQRSKLDKEDVQLKFKGNQKQFELNAELDAIFETIETESESIEPNLSQIKKLSQEGRQRIHKRQKLIKIANKNKDGWQVVAECELDELVSAAPGSEDEKRLKQAREAASRKRRQKEQQFSDRGKKPRISLGADNQFFRAKKKSLLFTLYIHMCFGYACASYHISRVIVVLREFKGKMIYVRLSKANQNVIISYFRITKLVLTKSIHFKSPITEANIFISYFRIA